jgi:hypothetical protein
MNQSAVQDLAAVTTTSSGQVVGGSVTGQLPAIVLIVGRTEPRFSFLFSPRNSSGVSALLAFSLTDIFPPGGSFVLTLSGAGIFAESQNISFVSSTPGVVGNFSINSNMVLSFRVTSGTLLPGAISFSIAGVRTPYHAQGEVNGLFGSILSSSNFVVAAFINASMSEVQPWLGFRMPALSLRPGIRGHDSSSLEISFIVERSFLRSAFLVVSLPNICIQFASTDAVKFLSPPVQALHGLEASAAISTGVIRINLHHSNSTSNPGQLFRIVIENVACPSASHFIAEGLTATLIDHNSEIIGLSNNGVLEHVAESLGAMMPLISISSQMPGAANVTFSIKVKPARIPLSPSRLVITLPGIGFFLTNNNVTCAPTSNGVIAEASIVGSDIDPSVSVLDIRIWSGSFDPRSILEFQLLSSFNIKNSSQKSSDSVLAAWLFSNGSICAASVSGHFPEIYPFFPHSSASFGSALKFVASPQIHGFEWEIDTTLAIFASMSKIHFSQQKYLDHIVMSVVPMFIGNDQLSVFHLKPGGLRMSVHACPEKIIFFDETACLSLSSQAAAPLEFKPDLIFNSIDKLPVLFVNWRGYIKMPRQELLTFEIQVVGRIRIWFDENLQIDSQAETFSGVISFSLNVTNVNSIAFVRIEFFGRHPQISVAVFWKSKRMARQVKMCCFVASRAAHTDKSGGSACRFVQPHAHFWQPVCNSS